MFDELLYYVRFSKNIEAQGRVFFSNEKYPVYCKDRNVVVLYAENGSFHFSNEMMEKIVKEWGLKIQFPSKRKETSYEERRKANL